MLRDYIGVVKPGIVAGNLAAVGAGFLLAARGTIDVPRLLSITAGMALVMASACALNNCADRRMDRLMSRTRLRALPDGRLAPAAVVRYAAGLGISGVGLIVTGANILSAAIAVAGLLIYAGAYSLWLKPASVYAPAVGSLAGAAPPLAGYCAATGRIDGGAVILLGIFGLWQMPHFYAIAIYRMEDYASAAIPVLPVARGVGTAKRHIVGHICAFMAAAMVLGASGYAGTGYLGAAAASGGLWLGMAWTGLRTRDDRRWARRMFVWSLVVICTLDVMMALDSSGAGRSQVLWTVARPF